LRWKSLNQGSKITSSGVMEMEYRRLQMSKGGSYLLSLPKGWVVRTGLKGGDVLRLEEGEGATLTIRIEGEVEPEKGSTEVIKEVEGIERQIRSNYLYGTDTIVIDLGRRMTPAIRDQIKGAIQKLIGLEVVEEDGGSVTVQCLLQPTSMPIRSTLRRAHVLAANMHKEAEDSLTTLDSDLALSVVKRDDEVDRLYFLMVRQLRLALRSPKVAEKLGVGSAECLDLRMAAKYVETIADLAAAVATAVPKLDRKEIDNEIMEALKELSRSSYKIHEDAAQALFSQNVKSAEEVMIKAKGLGDNLAAVNEMLTNKQPRMAPLLDSIAMYLYQIGAHGIDLAELVSGTRG
jgi:phosphate uptake regulator